MAADPDQLRRAEAFGAAILEHSVAVGGCISGEHGVGWRNCSRCRRSFRSGRTRAVRGTQGGLSIRNCCSTRQGHSHPAPLPGIPRPTRPPHACPVARSRQLAADNDRSQGSATRCAPPQQTARLYLRGGGSKTSADRPALRRTGARTREHRGVVSYRPEEMVLTARAGTRSAS
jgi:hypothetical protein